MAVYSLQSDPLKTGHSVLTREPGRCISSLLTHNGQLGSGPSLVPGPRPALSRTCGLLYRVAKRNEKAVGSREEEPPLFYFIQRSTNISHTSGHSQVLCQKPTAARQGPPAALDQRAGGRRTDLQPASLSNRRKAIDLEGLWSDRERAQVSGH